MNIANKILTKIKENDIYIVNDIKCLIDSENNKQETELYDNNKEKFNKINKIDKESIICYSIIRNKECDERIKRLSEINIIGCSLFIKELNGMYNEFDFVDNRNILLNLYNSVKNFTELYNLLKQENNDIINFIKYLDIDKYIIRIYVDHSVLYYYLNTTNEEYKKLFDYIFTSPLVEIYYYISPLSGKYILKHNDNICHFYHNDTFGTIMRLMPLFIKDEINFKTYNSRDCRISFGSIMDLLFIKLYKDEYFEKIPSIYSYNKYTNLFKEDVYATKYVVSVSEQHDDIIRYVSWVGCKKPIIESHGIKLLLSEDNELKDYLLKYGNHRIDSENITPYSYGVDEISRVVKPIIMYMIKKIYDHLSQFDKINNVNKISSLSEICLKNLKDDNSKCQYYYNNKGIIENKNHEILDIDYNKTLLRNIDKGVNNYFRIDEPAINNNYIDENIVGYIITDYNIKIDNNYFKIFNDRLTTYNGTAKFNSNIKYCNNTNKNYSYNVLFIIRNLMISKLINFYYSKCLYATGEDNVNFKYFIINMIFMFCIPYFHLTIKNQIDYIIYMYLYLNYCSIFDNNTRISLLLLLYPESNNMFYELPIHYHYVNDETFSMKDIYKIKYLKEFDKIMYDIHKEILNIKIHDKTIEKRLKIYLYYLQKIIYKKSKVKNENLLTYNYIFNSLKSNNFLYTLPFHSIAIDIFEHGLFSYNYSLNNTLYNKILIEDDDNYIINQHVLDKFNQIYNMFLSNNDICVQVDFDD